MPFNKPVRRIGLVGTGVIGASWAAYCDRGGIVAKEQSLPRTPEVTP